MKNPDDDRTTLIHIAVTHDLNDEGTRVYLVTPLYRLADGWVVSVPDSLGWPTREEAVAHAAEIAARHDREIEIGGDQ